MIASRGRRRAWRVGSAWRATARRVPGALLIALTVIATMPAVARSATAMVVPQTFLYRTVVAFDAAPTEVNDVLVTWLPNPSAAQSVVIHDSGAGLSSGNQCRSVDTHTVQCAPTLSSVSLIHVDVELGDGNDRVQVSGPPPGLTAGGGTVYAAGGSGDDVLDARRADIARLDGGGGRDQFYGATMETLFTDGDRDGATGDARPGPDVIQGGPGVDTLSYRQRTAPVMVDLSDDRGEGEIRERDLARAVESIEGGSGDDTLAGDRHDNALDGGLGRDVLIGRAGDDQFAGRSGSWTLVPPPADPDPDAPGASAAGDRVDCGAGSDLIVGRTARDFTPMNCEALGVQRALPKSLVGPVGWFRLNPYPAAVGRSLDYRFGCSSTDDWEFPAWRKLRCRGRVELRTTARGHRLLGWGRLRPSGPEWTGQMHARLALTSLGRGHTAHGHKVKARVSFHGLHLPIDRWTILLAGRRGA